MGRWTDIFKFGSSKTKAMPDPRIRWFGKLPTYADYYSSKTDAEWAVEFNDWILKGYEIYLNRHRESNRRSKKTLLPISGCAVRLPKSGMTVLASIQDYGGDMRGRSFPIVFYVGIPNELMPGPTSDRVGDVIRSVQALIRLRSDVMRFFKTPTRFESVFEDRHLELDAIDPKKSDNGWRAKAKTVSLTDWFDGARPAVELDDPNRWFSLVDRWGGHVKALEGNGFEPTFAFPLSACCGMDVQVSGWTRWLESRMDLKRRSLCLMVTGEQEEGTARLSVVARELVHEDFLLATALWRTLPYLDDLSAVGAHEQPTSEDGAGAGEPPGDEAPADGAPADRAPADRAPADGALADGAPVDASPAAPKTWLDFVEA
jgi:hypothetical protein